MTAIQLTFDNCALGSTTITTAEMKPGATYNPELNISETNTADGKLHQNPNYKGGSASLTLYGNKLALNSVKGAGGVVTLKSGSTTIFTGTGLVTASYDELSRNTSIEVKIDSI